MSKAQPKAKHSAKHSPLYAPRVTRLLLESRLDTLYARDIAARLNVSPSTMRRRLQREGTSYQAQLDRVRRYRCEQILARRWVPGKSLAAALGFQRPGSFYRAFEQWMGVSYGEYKRRRRYGLIPRPQRLY